MSRCPKVPFTWGGQKTHKGVGQRNAQRGGYGERWWPPKKSVVEITKDDIFDGNFKTALLWQVFPSVLFPFVCTDQVCVSFNQETELIEVHALIVKTWIFLEVSLCF